MRADLANVRDDVKSDVRALQADVAADFVASRKEVNEQIVGLRPRSNIPRRRSATASLSANSKRAFAAWSNI
jgi:hypothetical protein